ncbi:MAG: NAD(P)-dependent oxidoreductase, partial [Ktedonobacterales bacterium]
MKLTVFGATGGTGAYVVRMALEAGHLVTAVARNPERVDIRHENLRVLRGDVLDFASVDQAVSGQDAVISCIGSTRGQKPVTTYSAGTDNILRAMQAHGVKRFLCISANPLVVGNGDLLLDRIVLKPIVRQIFKESYADLRRMEAEV